MKLTFSYRDDADRIIHPHSREHERQDSSFDEEPRCVPRLGKTGPSKSTSDERHPNCRVGRRLWKSSTGAPALVERALGIKLTKEDLGDR
jgi:hypothetical protein